MFCRKQARYLRALFLALLLVQAILCAGQEKKTDCKKPPEVIPPGKQSKEEEQKHGKDKARGTVAIVISEDGEVVEAKAVDPSSGKDAKKLVSLAKSMKFKPRLGCGPFKTVMNFVVGY